jgi:hypothetical protein
MCSTAETGACVAHWILDAGCRSKKTRAHAQASRPGQAARHQAKRGAGLRRSGRSAAAGRGRPEPAGRRSRQAAARRISDVRVSTVRFQLGLAARAIEVIDRGRPVAVIDGHEFTALKLPLNAKLTGGPRAGAKRCPRDVRVERVRPRSRYQNPGPWLFQVRRPWDDQQPSRVHQQP